MFNQKARNRHSHAIHAVEVLETRRLLSTVVWSGGTNGTGTSWDTPSDWVGGVVPVSGDDAVINTAGTAIVISANDAVRSVSTSRSLTVNTGASLAIQGGTTAPQSTIKSAQTLTVNGAVTLANGVVLSFDASQYGSTTQVIVSGTLTATGTTFVQSGSNNSTTALNVTNGGHLIASNCTFNLGSLSLAAGSVFAGGDLAGDTFNLPIYVPSADIRYLSHDGGGEDNKLFNDINVVTDISAGSTVNFNAIGSVSTSSLRYVFPNSQSIGAGATLNVASGVPVFIASTRTLTVNGTLNLTNNVLTLDATQYGSTAQVIVNGTLNATGTTFVQNGSNSSTTALNVANGGHLVASTSTFNLGSLSLAAGSLFAAGDLSADTFNLPIYVPSADIRYLSLSGAQDNKLFNDINVITDIAAGSTVNFNLIGSVSTSNLRYVFPNSQAVGAAATLNVAAGVPVFIASTRTLTINGTLNLANGVVLTLDATQYGSTSQVLVNVNGTLSATAASFVQNGSNSSTSQLNVNNGGHLIASSCTFDLGSLSLAAGSLFGSNDLADNIFNLPIYVPSADIRYLSLAGGGKDNKLFNDINVTTDIAAGTTVNFNLIGTLSTSNLRYVFPNSQAIGASATLNVATGVPVYINPTRSLTVNGAMNLASGTVVTLDATQYGSTAQIIVNGTLTAISATFLQNGSNNSTSQLNVANGGHLIASNCTFNLGSLSLAAGSLFASTDLSGNIFNLPIYVPSIDIQYLSHAGGGEDNKLFNDINVVTDIAAGATVNFGSIGTLSTSNLRYVFPNSQSVAAGGTLNIASGIPVLINTTRTVTVNGTVTLASGAIVTLDAGQYGSTTQIIVNGTLNATGATFIQSGSNNSTTVLTINTGGHLIASNSNFSVDRMSINNGGNTADDSIALNFSSGNPLPRLLQLNGRFTISTLSPTILLAGTTIDIGASTVFITYPNAAGDPVTAVRSYLNNGFNGGTWTGVATAGGGAIKSSAAAAQNADRAIGYADSADVGNPAGLPANTIELRYTIIGDVNLDGSVGLTDLTTLLQNYSTGTKWDQGAITYNTVGLTDLTTLLQHYNATTASLAAVPATATLPDAVNAKAVTLSASSSPTDSTPKKAVRTTGKKHK